jgi:hypothetical protein
VGVLKPEVYGAGDPDASDGAGESVPA